MRKPIKLTDMQLHVYEALLSGRDTAISFLYGTLYGNTDAHTTTMQQRIGAHVSRINRALPDHKIVPGNKRRTYRLVRKPR